MEQQVRRWSTRLIWVVLTVTVVFFCTRVYYRLTDDFRIANITYDMPFNQDWETEPLTRVDKTRIRKILNQPFSYIGKGAQSYAFISEDHRYVLKFFKFKHLKPNWLVESLPNISLFDDYKNKKTARKKRLINSVFKGYKLAYDLHRKESGLVYIHLNKTRKLFGNGVLFDKIGREHQLNLDTTVFVIQENATTTRDVIKRALDSGDLELVNKRMDQIIDLYLLEYSKGIYDRDHGLMHNTGFIGERPIHLDVGKLSQETNMMKKEYLVADLEKLEIRFEDWLRIYYPQYHHQIISHLQEKMKGVLSENNEFLPKE